MSDRSDISKLEQSVAVIESRLGNIEDHRLQNIEDGQKTILEVMRQFNFPSQQSFDKLEARVTVLEGVAEKRGEQLGVIRARYADLLKLLGLIAGAGIAEFLYLIQRH